MSEWRDYVRELKDLIMATSPREELRIVTITEFREDPLGCWRWARHDAQGEIDRSTVWWPSDVEAVYAFFESVHYDPAVEDPALKHFSKPYNAGWPGKQMFHIREYNWGAPEPYGE